MSCLAWAYLKDDEERARDYADRALSTANELGDRVLKSQALQSLANVMVQQGRAREAYDLLNEALDLARQSGALNLESGILSTMGLAKESAGECEVAFTKFVYVGTEEGHYPVATFFP